MTDLRGGAFATPLAARAGLIQPWLDAIGRLVVAAWAAHRVPRAIQGSPVGGRLGRRVLTTTAIAALALRPGLLLGTLRRLLTTAPVALLAALALALLLSLFLTSALRLLAGRLLGGVTLLPLPVASLPLWAALLGLLLARALLALLLLRLLLTLLRLLGLGGGLRIRAAPSPPASGALRAGLAR